MEPDFLAIVDPWVTTLSFVVALAMRIQATKEQKKQGKNLEKLEKILEKFVCREELPKSVCDHSLGGVYRGHRECHIEPDWLLIYRIKEDELVYAILIAFCVTAALCSFWWQDLSHIYRN